jgi:hypothetical protein
VLPQTGVWLAGQTDVSATYMPLVGAAAVSSPIGS